MHQLLGLRLLFSSSWKIIWWQQLYLSKKFSRFVLVSVRSSNRAKAATRYKLYYFSAKLKFGFLKQNLLHSYFFIFKNQNWNFLQAGRISQNGRDAVCELFAEYLPEKDCRIATWKILRRKLCGNFRGGKLFFNGQFAKIQAIKYSL